MTSLCLVTTLRASLSATLSFVNYHLNCGVDWLFLYFDSPEDPAIDLVRNHPRVSCIQCDCEYWRNSVNGRRGNKLERQRVNATHALGLARAMGIDWIAHIDGDELLYCRNEMHKSLEQARAQIVRFPVLEAVPERLSCTNVFTDVSLFRVERRRWIQQLALAAGCRNSFFSGSFFRGHTASKCAVKVDASIKNMGIHFPEMEEDVDMDQSREIQLLHFDSSSFAAWKNKWSMRLNDPDCLWHQRSPARYRQFCLFRDALNRTRSERSLEELYRRLYFIHGYEKIILQLLRLLTRIHIDHKMFKMPEKSNSPVSPFPGI